MKGGTHSRFNGDFCSGLGKKDLFFAIWFVYSEGLAGCTRASFILHCVPRRAPTISASRQISVLLFLLGFTGWIYPFSNYAVFTVSRRIIDYW
ncbi:hypothetical protein B0I37DRAFT_382679 [Chaetomium sp. MPI-CAGE-AT-0009]|nr:hypothetical protein B0I37DRAFT_382679 [Chaetomium sp. MPI-CAGE-AT-0009]